MRPNLEIRIFTKISTLAYFQAFKYIEDFFPIQSLSSSLKETCLEAFLYAPHLRGRRELRVVPYVNKNLSTFRVDPE